MYKTTCTCLLLRDLLEGRHGDGRTSPVMSEERERGKKNEQSKNKYSSTKWAEAKWCM